MSQRNRTKTISVFASSDPQGPSKAFRAGLRCRDERRDLRTALNEARELFRFDRAAVA